MHPLLLGLVFLGVLLLCVGLMAIGVLAGRKPLRSCGEGAMKYKGEVMDCPACAKSACPNNRGGACHRDTGKDAHP